ncbi:hypothetical protein TIFTF001_009608 [Ficus carica]|uniref:Ionotropic glutamate receptor C-terminal domain-containing protein n=1 Tax=Ficus carica TaxID=3494 RepID=A0AA88D1F5_FICCA|nr:hypothetical protein TIFTF001_009608 [Ficus carica]
MIGRVAKFAIDAAVEDVNSDPLLLRETKLKVMMQDTKTNEFLGIVEAFRFMENDTVAIIGPQFSVMAHVISHVANELQVPLLSFAAIDSTLTPPQFPFFVRTTHSDAFQMAAVADLVGYYEWRDVVAIYVDDDFGTNGISKLGDKLAEKRCKISYKAPLRSKASKEEIRRTLIQVSNTESRIIVIHVYPSLGLEVLEPSLLSEKSDDIQGVLTLRMHTPDSQLKTRFLSKWTNLTSSISGSSNLGKNGSSFGLNTYGLYAYDSVWLLATALNSFLDRKGNFSFSNDSSLTEMREGNMRLDSMRIFDGGNLLLQNIVNVDTTGVTGPLVFNSDMDLIDPAYQVINIIGSGINTIGYWSNSSGLSTLRPEALQHKHSTSHNSSQQLSGVLWPGKTTHKPRGWVFPNNGKQLRIGVPNRFSFNQFIWHVDGSGGFTGFCIDVFMAAVEQLQYGVSYKFIPYGDGRTNPSTNELLKMVTKGVISDHTFEKEITGYALTTDLRRSCGRHHNHDESNENGGFHTTIHRIRASGGCSDKEAQPKCMGVSEAFHSHDVERHRCFLANRRRSYLDLGAPTNDNFRGPPRKQLVTIIWFSFSTLFSTHREKTGSTLARFVLIVWLFVVLVLNSSYKASLTSILTVEQLSSSVKGIESLVTSGQSIGYTTGSFTENYLTEELGVPKSRLVPLKSQLDYEKALKDGPSHGGIAAVVDERPYMELFLSTRCEFSIVGQDFTKMGWGFVKYLSSIL